MRTFLFTFCILLNLHPLFAQQPMLSSGTVTRYEKFASNYIEPRTVDVWLPDGYTKQKKYAVVYMHDGQMLFDAGSTWNKQEWGVDETFGKLMAEGKIKDCIVVAVWNINGLRRAEYFPQKVLQYVSEPEKSKAQGEKLLADNYLKFLVEELKPFIDQQYATKSQASSTFLLGSSMGGLISLYGVCEYPEVFGGAACLSIHSPLLTDMRVQQNPDSEYAAALRTYVAAKLPKQPKRKIYMDYGTATLDALYQQTQPKLDLAMKSAGYTGKHWITKKFEGDAHDEIAWAKRLSIPVLFLLKK
ncbi:MAG: hypothetical protein RI924_1081 [Bacteroidota bacterium]|jgi:enterochelin esterase-like enzyme